MLKTIVRRISSVLLLCIMAAGIFTVVIAVAGGFNAHTLGRKLVIGAFGIVVALLALETAYVVNGKNAEALVDDLFWFLLIV